jgi:VanZ family protein
MIKFKTYRPFLFAALAVLSILFFFGGPDYHSIRSFKAMWNLGHILYFALLPLLVFLHPRLKAAPPRTQIFLIIGLTLVIGIFVEMLQYGIDRFPDIQDIYRNLIGAMVAVVFLLPVRNSIPNVLLNFLRMAVVLMVVAQLVPIAVALIDEHHARRDFPNLSDFQTPFQIHRWKGGAGISIANDVGTAGNRVLQADLTTSQYSGVAMTYFPANWQQYQRLQFRVLNPSPQPLSLTCRIHDELHTRGIQRYQDRFNQTYAISQGWNTITIDLSEVQQSPQNRSMDLTQIRGIGIFATRLAQPRTIYIDDLILF